MRCRYNQIQMMDFLHGGIRTQVRRSTLLALLVLCAAAGTAGALNPDLAITQYVQNVWRAPQFLPHDDIASIVQTRDGYLWVGTVEGLARFDGVRSIIYNKSNTPAIANNWIRALLEDRQGRLWIGTFGGGLVCLKDGKFTRFGAKEGLPADTIFSLFEDRDGHVLIGTLGYGIVRFENGKFLREPGTESLSADSARAIVQDRQGAMWYGTDTGVYRLDKGRMTHIGKADGLTDDVIMSMAVDDQGIWIGTEKGGVNRWGQGKIWSITTKDGLLHNRIWSLCVDRDKNVWIGTDGGGLNRWSRGRLSALNTKNGLTNDYVWALYEDREGSLWIATNGGGLNRLKNGLFVTLTTREGLPSDFIWSILRTRDGSLWIGTEDAGVTRIREGSMTTFPLPEKITANAKVLFEDRNGNLWIGGHQGLDRWQDERIVPAGIPELVGKTVNAFAEDKDGALWVGTSSMGLVRIQDGRLQQFSRTEGLSSDSVSSLLLAPDGSLWIGTSGGVNHLSNGRFSSFTTRNGLLSDYVTALLQTSDGTIWAATRAGLARIRNGRVEVVTSANGLYDDAVMSVVAGGEGAIWMGSNRGAFRASLKELNAVLDGSMERIHCLSFGLDDGLRNVEVNGAQTSLWKDPDGRLWFATRGGASWIQPKVFNARTSHPRILIEEVVADGKSLKGNGVWQLPAGTFNLEIHFTAMSLLSPSTMKFRYRLEGFDPDWADSGPNRTAHYTNLPHGRYRFRVISARADGAWVDTGAGAEIAVEPRIYETLWFRILAAVVVLLAGPIFYIIRTRRLKRQKAELERIVAERTAEVQAANERLAQIAREDSLTGLANRRRLDEALEEEWRRAFRTGTSLALLLIDVDHFKPYNDQLGHQAGDNCLKAVAATLAEVCKRAGELVARFGGEEFAVILPAINMKGAETTAGIILRRVRELAIPHPQSVAPVITVSVGVAWLYPHDGGGVPDLIRAADSALYRAKSNGRNRMEMSSAL